MEISKEQVEFIAELSKLEFNDNKLDKLTKDLGSIVEFAEQLNEIDVEGIEPTAHILDVKNVYRKDKVKKSFERDIILENAPKKEVGCIVVPKTVD